jgi:NAD(P)H-flavin reductase
VSEYESQLKNAAVNRVTEFYKVSPASRTIDDLISDATKLTAFFYNQEEHETYLKDRLDEIDHSKKTKAAIHMKPVSVKAN